MRLIAGGEEMVMEHPADEIRDLKACINNLISVLALPALWTGREPAQIISTLLDVLFGMLRLDFAYSRLNDSIDGTPIEMVRLAGPRNLMAQPQEIGQMLNPWLRGDPSTLRLVVPNPIGEGEVSIASLPLGLQDEVGVLIAGSQRADFPTETEKLLLRVAANQTAIGLQEARLLSEQRRLAEELDRRVAERTSQLVAANEVLIKEINERKSAEEALRTTQAQFKAVLDYSPLLMFLKDTEGRYIEINPRFEEAFQITREQTIGKTDAEIFSPEQAASFRANDLKVLQGNAPLELEEIAHYSDGPHLSIAHKFPLHDSQGTIYALCGIAMDITERRRAREALEKAQSELAHVSRLTTLGEMAASIAHEINQPLGAIVNNASACLRWLAANNLEEARHSAALIRADGNRAGEIINRIRSFAKKAPPQKDWIDINETILEVIELARSEAYKNRVSLQTQLSSDLPRILGDRIQLQQVILNLLMNGIEAMTSVTDWSRDLLIRSGPYDSNSVAVEVQDSGLGLKPETVDHLFYPFYTTKPHGMGMGLAICRSIIEAHGGRLWATVNEDRGATFQFTLPSGGRGSGMIA
jgi:PAS domain S-box-containing protein